MDERKQGYVAYMLRLWQVRSGEEWSWRASLEHARTGTRKGFAGVEELCAYLQTHAISTPSPPSQQPSRTCRSAQQSQAAPPSEKGTAK